MLCASCLANICTLLRVGTSPPLSGLIIYKSTLKWPDYLPIEITKRVTYLEFTIDFDKSGIALPGGAKRLHQLGDRSIRRGAAQVIGSVF